MGLGVVAETDWEERVGVMAGGWSVGAAMLERWGIRLGVTTTAGILGGGEPRTAALGEEFHRGRASMGIRPPVPVPRDDGGLPIEEYLLFLGVKRGIFRRGSREDVDDVMETERFRGVGVGSRLSLLRGGREVTLFPADRKVESRREDDESRASGEIWVRVVVLEVLP
jgi:hypothetical protein